MSRMDISRRTFKVVDLVGWQDSLLLDPVYQREGSIWVKGRQQLFIDSILNSFDVPALYLHRLRPPEFRDGRSATYAVIDGRQRLEALELFASNGLRLADNFRLLEDVPDAQPALLDELAPGKERFGGYNLADLRAESPSLVYRFMDYEVPVTIVDTDDPELIEELFYRLNEGVPLNPAEKSTRGELLRTTIHPLVHDEDVFRCAGFKNVRRRYEDLLLRLIFVRSRNGSIRDLPDMKRTLIDAFAKSFRPEMGETFDLTQRDNLASQLRTYVDAIRPTLDTMNAIFDQDDVLLRQQGTFLVYYLVIEEVLRLKAALPTRDTFIDFGAELTSLGGQDEENLTPDQLDALEYGTPLRETTTGSYTQRKAEVLLRYVLGDLKIV